MMGSFRVYGRWTGERYADLVCEFVEEDTPIPEGADRIRSLWCDIRTEEGRAYVREQLKASVVPSSLIERVLSQYARP